MYFFYSVFDLWHKYFLLCHPPCFTCFLFVSSFNDFLSVPSATYIFYVFGAAVAQEKLWIMGWGLMFCSPGLHMFLGKILNSKDSASKSIEQTILWSYYEVLRVVSRVRKVLHTSLFYNLSIYFNKIRTHGIHSWRYCW